MFKQQAQGFTLIELIMVIVIVGILSTMTTDIITLPVNSYIDLERRTTLANNAETSLRRMQRDIRRALPNSIRISGSNILELIHTTDGGRYRAKLASDGLGNILDFTSADTGFDVIGSLSTTPNGELVIYNLGSTAADAYVGNNRTSIDNTSTITTITLSSAKLFSLQSPQQRFFIIDTPITYSCFNGELGRYDNRIDGSYIINSSIPTLISLASLNYKIQAKATTLSCAFSYTAGTATRDGLVTLEITLTDQAGESASLLYQVHVDNIP